MKKLLLIDNHDSFTYNLVDLLRKLSVDFTVKAVELVSVTEVTNYSHLLISPGPDVPKAYPQTFEILEKYHREKSILGVCLGHQMLCEFFGGVLYNLNHVRHGQEGLLTVNKNSLLFKGLPKQFDIGLYHSWAVSAVDFPQDLQITATCQDEIVMAMQHKTLPIYGVQFHPESFITQFGREMLENWLSQS
ncbi:para-aminobenzoate synthetase component 2 [Cricetibacter osteomyelitidis]|uniref:Para-aminobenzoate synthetase component 2 n=1 Tax=Cricetibacter osteomyelitidis TaxID=1521931 RepID=A0A4R2T3Y4_9PAST|nr:anthranilate synthase component II [Cricetibacter osteomyelitidis]TCP95544.1 para-aminobenzoate synthetase component 2 [Cricetibacter osteomyelitidis]